MKIAIFTREEKRIIEDLRESRGWDPDVRALIAIFDAAQPRFDERVMNLDVLNEAGDILFKRVKANAIYHDMFGTGKIGVCRRSGVFGAGNTLRDACRDLQKNEKIDKKPLDKRGWPPAPEVFARPAEDRNPTELEFRDDDPETSSESDPSSGR